jgi:F-type H+-transporting ATPase subunit b
MASRLARNVAGILLSHSYQRIECVLILYSLVGAARLRPTLSTRTVPALTTLTTARYASNVPAEEPKKKAQSIIDSLPGNSLISKTAILSAGAGISIAAISNELYVVNEESIVAFCLLSIFWAVGKYGGPMYKEWADSQIAKIKGILNAAREDHTQAVKQRIENVKELASVIEITKSLFEVSKVYLYSDQFTARTLC